MSLREHVLRAFPALKKTQFVWWLPYTERDPEDRLHIVLPAWHFGSIPIDGSYVKVYRWRFNLGPLEIRRLV